MLLLGLYDAGIALYVMALHIAAGFHPKARKWVQGRAHWESRLQDQIAEKFIPGKARLWMHCASLGEFEQGRPVLEAWRNQHPDSQILLTFFSPSGYEIRKDYPGADIVTYLPADTPRAARRFVELVQPDSGHFCEIRILAAHPAGFVFAQHPCAAHLSCFPARSDFFQMVRRPLEKSIVRFSTHFCAGCRFDGIVTTTWYSDV
jgi:3-deoxy-D-manno-octulosonic-acid transferase